MSLMRCAKTLFAGKAQTHGVTMSPQWFFRFRDDEK
jgi:hypothetical protein